MANPTPAQVAQARELAEALVLRYVDITGDAGMVDDFARDLAPALATAHAEGRQAEREAMTSVECTCRVIEKCDRCEAIDARLATEARS